MNNKVSLKKHLVLFLLLGCNTVAFSQLGTGISARKPALPTYSTPYVIPTVKDVKNIVDRIQQRVEKNSLFYLVDSINGQTISYSQPNKSDLSTRSILLYRVVISEWCLTFCLQRSL